MVKMWIIRFLSRKVVALGALILGWFQLAITAVLVAILIVLLSPKDQDKESNE
jgi:hypothetical protein